VAQIVYAAFEPKLSALGIARAAAVDVIARAVRPETGFIAYLQGRLVGVAGTATAQRGFLQIRYPDLRAHYGPLRAGLYYAVLTSEKIADDEVRIGPLAVARDVRGQGIGSALLDAVERWAVENRYRRLSLDVVDTNAGAIRLYERFGFRIVKTARFGLLTRRAGFTRSHRMHKEIR